MVRHVDLENGKISNVKWKADHLIENVIPEEHNTYNLGSTEKRWNNVYVKYIYTADFIKARTLFFDPYGKAFTPGSTYTTIPATKTRIDFSQLGSGYARIYAYAYYQLVASANPGIRVACDDGTLAELTSITASPSLCVSDWTEFNLDEDTEIYVQCKMRTGYKIYIYSVGLELRT